jgi:hypothetical protein
LIGPNASFRCCAIMRTVQPPSPGFGEGQRGELLGARAATLDARVAVYSVNFGEASRHLKDARGLLRRADERLKSLGRDNEVKQLETALAGIDDAQRLAGKLDQNANSRAGEAAKVLADVLDAEAKR